MDERRWPKNPTLAGISGTYEHAQAKKIRQVMCADGFERTYQQQIPNSCSLWGSGLRGEPNRSSSEVIAYGYYGWNTKHDRA